MINITNVVRVSLSAVFFAGIVVSLLFADELGKVTVTCFSLGSLCLFCGIGVIPLLLTRRETKLEKEHYQISPLSPLVQHQKAEAFRAYDSPAKALIGIGLALLLIGIIAFAAAT